MKSLNWKTIKNAAKSGKENLDHFASTYVLNFTVAEKELDKESDLVEVQDLGTGFLMVFQLREFIGGGATRWSASSSRTRTRRT